MPQERYNVIVLISGNGSNLQALIDACASSELPQTHITHVISNRKGVKGLQRAADASIPTSYHNLVAYKKKHSQTPEGIVAARAAYDTDLASLILALDPRPNIIVCAGWMHILSPSFLNPISAAGIKVINLHPALPGEFPGDKAIERAWEAGRKSETSRTGVMVHEVIAEVDAGNAIITQEVPLKENETLEDLTERIHQVEYQLIVEATRRTLAKGQA